MGGSDLKDAACLMYSFCPCKELLSEFSLKVQECLTSDMHLSHIQPVLAGPR